VIHGKGQNNIENLSIISTDYFTLKIADISYITSSSTYIHLNIELNISLEKIIGSILNVKENWDIFISYMIL